VWRVAGALQRRKVVRPLEPGAARERREQERVRAHEMEPADVGFGKRAPLLARQGIFGENRVSIHGKTLAFGCIIIQPEQQLLNGIETHAGNKQ
jgi:hypothetical protein